MGKRQRETIDELARAVKDIHPSRLAQILDKSERVNLRVSEVDKRTMQELAKGLNLTVTEYLTRLHSLVFEKLKEKYRLK